MHVFCYIIDFALVGDEEVSGEMRTVLDMYIGFGDHVIIIVDGANFPPKLFDSCPF